MATPQDKLADSIVLLAEDSENPVKFYTGFIFHLDGRFAYILTSSIINSDTKLKLTGKGISIRDISLKVIKDKNTDVTSNYCDSKNNIDYIENKTLRIAVLRVRDERKARVCCTIAKDFSPSYNQPKLKIFAYLYNNYIEPAEIDKVFEASHNNFDNEFHEYPFIFDNYHSYHQGMIGAPVITNNYEVIGVMLPPKENSKTSDGTQKYNFLDVKSIISLMPELFHLVSYHTSDRYLHTKRNDVRLMKRIESASYTIDVSGFTLKSMSENHVLSQLQNRIIDESVKKMRFLAMDPEGKAKLQVVGRYIKEICALRNGDIFNEDYKEKFCNNECNKDQDCDSLSKLQIKLNNCIMEENAFMNRSFFEEKLLEKGMKRLMTMRLDNLINNLTIIKLNKDHKDYSDDILNDRDIQEIADHIDKKTNLIYWSKINYNINILEKYNGIFTNLTKEKVEFKVIDQRLPTGCFIIDRETDEWGVLHAEIEITKPNDLFINKEIVDIKVHGKTNIQNRENDSTPMLILYKKSDKNTFNKIISDYESLFEGARTYPGRN
ncbi:MAG: hypothetical protein V2B20_24810 [Pseudomonadota bacterium]